MLAFQIALQFPYRFWDSKVQGADFFGHVPPSASKRGLFAVFYDMDPQVKSWVLDRGLDSLNSLEFGLVVTSVSSPGTNGHCRHSGCLSVCWGDTCRACLPVGKEPLYLSYSTNVGPWEMNSLPWKWKNSS